MVNLVALGQMALPYIGTLENSLQCFDTVGWAQEGHPGCEKLDVGLSVMTI